MANKIHINTGSEGKRPLRFSQCLGQQNARAIYTACCNGRKLMFENDGIAITQSDDASKPYLTLRFLGAKGSTPAAYLSDSPIADTPKGGCPMCRLETPPAYGMLKYSGIWEGVDLELSECDSGLKLNWVLSTPCAVRSIRLMWEGAQGLEVAEDGSLRITHPHGILTDEMPKAWQVVDAEFTPIGCAYKLTGKTEYTFDIACGCDEESPIVIDPII